MVVEASRRDKRNGRTVASREAGAPVMEATGKRRAREETVSPVRTMRVLPREGEDRVAARRGSERGLIVGTVARAAPLAARKAVTREEMVGLPEREALIYFPTMMSIQTTPGEAERTVPKTPNPEGEGIWNEKR